MSLIYFTLEHLQPTPYQAVSVLDFSFLPPLGVHLLVVPTPQQQQHQPHELLLYLQMSPGLPLRLLLLSILRTPPEHSLKRCVSTSPATSASAPPRQTGHFQLHHQLRTCLSPTPTARPIKNTGSCPPLMASSELGLHLTT